MKTGPAPAAAFSGMDFMPVANREARVASRKTRSYYIRVCLAGVFLWTILVRLNTPALGPVGPQLFHTLSLMAYLYCLFAGSLRTFDALAREKREGTLGLLLLTDLKPFQILSGKLLSASAMTIFGLLSFLPMLSIPILLGGVTFDQVTRVCLNLLNTLLLSMAWGLLISAATRKYVVGLTLACAAPILFGLVPISLIERLNPSDPATYPFYLLATFPSPALPHFLAAQTRGHLMEMFWPALAFNFVLASSYLWLANFLFPRCWQELPRKSAIMDAIRAFRRRWRYGDSQNLVLRRQLLEANPLDWLAQREWITSLGHFGLVAICICSLALSQFLNVPELGLIIASLAILYRMAHAASQMISEDQKSGALELLLTTTAPVYEIIDGLHQAMRRRFVTPVLLVCLWPWLFMIESAGEFFKPLIISSSILLIATWHTLSWVGIWYALRKPPGLAAWTALGVVALPPWLIWVVSIFPYIFDTTVSDVRTIGAIVCAMIGVGHCILLVRWAKELVFAHFREAAADPFATISFEPVFSGPRASIESAITVAPLGLGKILVYPDGDALGAKLIAVPSRNQQFLGWGGDARGTENPLRLELKRKLFVYAKFTEH